MAAPGKPSRWGSFLSQAVAGVESRLDNILAEAEEVQSNEASAATSGLPKPSGLPLPTASSSPLQAAAAGKTSNGNSRSSSSNRMNDRLQARLAKAVAAKNAQAGDGKPVASASISSSASPRSSVDHSTRASIEQQQQTSVTEKLEGRNTDVEPEATAPSDTASATIKLPDSADADDANEPIPSQTAQNPDATTVEVTDEPSDFTDLAQNSEAARLKPPSSVSDRTEIAELTFELEDIKKKQQEEIQDYIERVDTLQAKLQYLSKNAATSAKKQASSAPSGSLERKLSEKDERIALLMEEGQKLSNSEQKFRTTIKKLRQQAGDYEKQIEELKKGKDKYKSEAEALRNRISGSDEKEKKQQEVRKATSALQKELDSLTKDKVKREEAHLKLEQELKAKTEQIEGANIDGLNKALSTERENVKRLEDTNATLRAKIEALSTKASQEAVEWREKLERSVERGQGVEAELKLELSAMDTKLEAMRTAAEEVSSALGGDAQVKLLRQIETLQTQYATASSNWQGIETSLLAKAANLEKERDEAQRRESEMRKKARDSTTRCRLLEDELQEVQLGAMAKQQDLEACRKQLSSLQSTYKATEIALEQTRADLEKEQRSGNRGYRNQTEQQLQQDWAEEVAGATSKGHSGPASPLLSVSRTFSSDLIGSSLGKSRLMPTPGSRPDSPAEGTHIGRRLSSQPPIRRSQASTTGSGPPPSPFSPFEPPGELSHEPSTAILDRDDGVNDTRPSSPRNVTQDMISVSTVAAGPSVQVMERMSAAIRRLEAEKVTAKEEMVRVCSQRDEARVDMVSLMKDLEEANTRSSRVPQLEEEVSCLNARYQTTLEMLGEKSELVEELKADVEDVKAMYRELVERTVK